MFGTINAGIAGSIYVVGIPLIHNCQWRLVALSMALPHLTSQKGALVTMGPKNLKEGRFLASKILVTTYKNDVFWGQWYWFQKTKTPVGDYLNTLRGKEI